mgnify:CR=1 FL=1
MTIIDISLPITADLTTWPGDPTPCLTRVCDRAAGAVCTVTRLHLGAHTGTHLDAPCHFVDGPDIATVDLGRLIGPAVLIDVGAASVITAAVLADLVPVTCRRLLIRSRNSRLWADPTHTFAEDFTALDPGAADWAVTAGIDLIGVDYLSVATASHGEAVHRRLLGAGILLLEGLDLRAPPVGHYTLIALPLRLPGCDGSPVRAVLLDGPPPS